MTEAQIETLSLAEVLALRSRHIAEQKRREKELRYILAALTGNKKLIQDSEVPKIPKATNLDQSAMEFSRRLAELGV